MFRSSFFYIICFLLFSCREMGSGAYLGILLLGSPAGGSVATGIWKKRLPISFDNTGRGQLVNFPATIRLTAARVDFSLIQDNGADIRFYSEDMETLLKHELVWFDPVQEKAEMQVLVPQIAAGTSTDRIYMLYNNETAADGQQASALWSNYTAVYHLSEGSGQYLDSTGDHSSTSVTVTDRQNTEGIAGGPAPVFSNHEIQLGNWNVSPAGPGNDGLTMEMFLKFNSFATSDGRLLTKSTSFVSDADHTWAISTFGGGPHYLRARIRTAGTTTAILDSDVTGPLASGTWYHIVSTYDDTTGKVYLNGNLVESAAFTGLLDQDARSIVVGRHPDGSRPLDGVMDELRIAPFAVSEDFLDATNESFRDSMQSYGAVENL